MRYVSNSRRGISAIEAIVGVTLAVLVILFSVSAIVGFINEGSAQVEKTRALYLAEEALEVARLWRDRGWQNIADLSPGTPYSIDWGGAIPATTTTALLVDDVFSQTLTLEEVCRNGSDDIVPCGSGEDPETFLVVATVGWDASLITLETYLMNIHNH